MRAKINVRIESGDEGGEPRVQEMHNLTVDDGLAYVLEHGATAFDTVGYGAGTTSPAHDDTALEDEQFSEEMTIEPAVDSGEGYAMVTYYHYLGSAAGALGSITEAGLFVGATLIARVVFDSITKEATTYIKVRWEVVLWEDEVI